MKSRLMGVLAFLLLFAPVRLAAQGIYEGFAVPRTVTATGRTEVAGSIIVSLRFGVTMSGTLAIDMSPLQITNASATDIYVESALIGVGATTIDTEKSLVRIPVLAGAASGSIRIDGIRVSVAGTGISSFNARLSWEDSLNRFTAGTDLVVINAVQTGLAADPITDRFIIHGGQIQDNTSTITLREGYAGAFSSPPGFGQTTGTRIRIRVTDFPENLRMIFPSAVTAVESASTLTTVEGGGVTLPRTGGNTEVTYIFSGAPDSDSLVESFNIQFTVALTGAVGSTQPTLEVSLAPIGAAVPNSVLPSTDIPRYAREDIVVQEGSSRIITKVLYWTGATGDANRLTILNPSSSAANLTIDALNSSGAVVNGTGSSGPVKISLSANQAHVRTLSELFGAADGITSVRIQSTNSSALAIAHVSGQGVAETVPFLTRAVSSAIVPVANEGAQLRLLNPNSSAASGTLALRAEDGRTLGATSVQLGPLASISVSLATAFANPGRGYVQASFSAPVILFETFGESGATNTFGIQPPASAGSLFVPFFAAGNGFDADINLVNVSDETVTLTARLFDGSGSPAGDAVPILIRPEEQVAAPLKQIFSGAPAAGYARFEVPQMFKAFFSFYPAIVGHVRIRSAQGGSTVIPLSAHPLQDSYILGSGTLSSEFQGIALVNPGTLPVSVTLQAMNPSGTVLGSANIALGAGEMSARLTNQFFGAGIPADSVIRITATAPVVSSSIIGSNGLDVLRALPVLR
jgi:hypothetical protein